MKLIAPLQVSAKKQKLLRTAEQPALGETAVTSEAAAVLQHPSECALEEQNFFVRAFNATVDFFANLGNTVRGWFK